MRRPDGRSAEGRGGPNRTAPCMWLAALALTALALGAAPRSGFETMTPELQAMQRDDLANPGMLYVAEGEAVWTQEGCGSCHTVAAMRSVAAHYPALDATSNAPIDLAGRIA